MDARQRGVQVAVETVIPYLVLDDSYAKQPNFEGAKYVMSPPIREKSQQSKLWQHLRSGNINTVATDHAPFDFQGQKRWGVLTSPRSPMGFLPWRTGLICFTRMVFAVGKSIYAPLWTWQAPSG